VAPSTVAPGATATLTGINLIADNAVVNGLTGGAVPLTGSATSATFTVPASVPAGTYNIYVTNALGQSGTVPLVVQQNKFSASGVVFEDLNGNGTVDASEAKRQGENVILSLDVAPYTPITTVTTNANGAYAFNDLAAGHYRVTHGAPSGYVKTTDDSRPFDVGPSLTHNFGIKPLPGGALGTALICASEQDKKQQTDDFENFADGATKDFGWRTITYPNTSVTVKKDQGKSGNGLVLVDTNSVSGQEAHALVQRQIPPTDNGSVSFDIRPKQTTGHFTLILQSPEAQGSTFNLYLWRDGTIRYFDSKKTTEAEQYVKIGTATYQKDVWQRLTIAWTPTGIKVSKDGQALHSGQLPYSYPDNVGKQTTFDLFSGWAEQAGASAEDAGRLAAIATDAAFMREWESCEPLAAGITSLPLRQLAETVNVGPIVTRLVAGEPAIEMFERRHDRARELLTQLATALEEERVAPAALVAEALESRVSAALDRALTAEALRLPQEIRRVVVEFRQARDGRAAPLRAFLDANANLERAHIVLDQRETTVRSGGTRPALRDIRLYGEIIDTCDAGFAELARIEEELAHIEDGLDRHRAAFLALCDRARATANMVAQVRAAAQMLQIPLSDAMSAQVEKETRRLDDAVETYTAEMDAGFEAPQRNMSVRRLESELPSRKEYHAALTRPRAESLFRVPATDRDEEIRRLILLTYDLTCTDNRVKGRSINAVANSIMVRAGFVREEESGRARELFASKEATAWRQTHFDHTTVGQRGHIYIPNPAGRKLAKAYARELADARDFTERLLRALQEHRAAVAQEEAAKKKAKA